MTLHDIAKSFIGMDAAMLSFSYVNGRWQANLRLARSSGWKIATEDTIEAAIAAVLVLGRAEADAYARPAPPVEEEDIFG
jgi:hypothetical protein